MYVAEFQMNNLYTNFEGLLVSQPALYYPHLSTPGLLVIRISMFPYFVQYRITLP